MGPAAEPGDERRHLQTGDGGLDLLSCGRGYQKDVVAHQLDQFAARAEQQSEAHLRIPVDADDHLGDTIRDHALDQQFPR